MSRPEHSSQAIDLVDTFKTSAAVKFGFFNITLPVLSSTIVRDTPRNGDKELPVLAYADLSGADAQDTDILFGKDKVTLLEASLSLNENGHFIPFDPAMDKLPVKGNLRHHKTVMKDGINDGIYIQDDHVGHIQSVLIVGEQIYFLPLSTEDVLARVNNRDNEIKADVSRWLSSNDVTIG